MNGSKIVVSSDALKEVIVLALLLDNFSSGLKNKNTQINMGIL